MRKKNGDGGDSYGWQAFWFLAGVGVVHSYIWRNTNIPEDGSLPFFIISMAVTLAIVAVFTGITSLFKKQ